MKLIILIFPLFLFSQNNYQVKYNMITLFDGVKNHDAKLTFSDLQSCFEYKLSVKDTATLESQDENGNFKISVADKKEYKVYYDVKKKLVTEIKYLKNSYLIQDTISKPDWNILNETKTISNHLCQKATTTYKGRDYEVWFTFEYPTKFGPWKLIGLPGLIILANDTKNEVFFEATEISKISENIETPIFSIKPVSLKEFEIETQKYYQEIEKRIKAMGDRNTSVKVKFGKSSGLEITE